MSDTRNEETMKRNVSGSHPMLEELDPELADEIEKVADAMPLVPVAPSRAVSLDDNNGSDGVRVLLKRAAKECLYCCGVEIGKKPVEDMIADAVKNNAPNWESLEHDLDTHIAGNHQRDWLDCAKIVNGISLDIQAAVGTPAEYAAKQRRARSPRPDGCQRGRSQSPNRDRQRGRSRDRSHGRRQSRSPAWGRPKRCQQGHLCERSPLRNRTEAQSGSTQTTPVKVASGDHFDAMPDTVARLAEGKKPNKFRYHKESYHDEETRKDKEQQQMTDAKQDALDSDFEPEDEETDYDDEY